MTRCFSEDSCGKCQNHTSLCARCNPVERLEFRRSDLTRRLPASREILPREQPLNRLAEFPADPQQGGCAYLFLTALRIRKEALAHSNPLRELSLGHIVAP